MTNWRGIVAPPGLSDAERDEVVDFVEKLRATPQWKANLKRFGWTELAKSGADFDPFLESRASSA